MMKEKKVEREGEGGRREERRRKKKQKMSREYNCLQTNIIMTYLNDTNTQTNINRQNTLTIHLIKTDEYH